MGDGHGRLDAKFRPAARVVLIDDMDRVLLSEVEVPRQQLSHRIGTAPTPKRLWITPGGGLDDGETHEDAALRELYEETGLRVESLGPCIWKRRHIWQWEEKWIDSDEWFYLLRTPAFDVAPAAPDDWEMQYVHGHRWWSVQELLNSQSVETFVPRRLPELLEPILVGDIPIQPVDVGV